MVDRRMHVHSRSMLQGRRPDSVLHEIRDTLLGQFPGRETRIGRRTRRYPIHPERPPILPLVVPGIEVHRLAQATSLSGPVVLPPAAGPQPDSNRHRLVVIQQRRRQRSPRPVLLQKSVSGLPEDHAMTGSQRLRHAHPGLPYTTLLDVTSQSRSETGRRPAFKRRCSPPRAAEIGGYAALK
jgi:hypothetical protein